MYDRLIVLTVSTGLLTTIASGVTLALLVRDTRSYNLSAPYGHALYSRIPLSPLTLHSLLFIGKLYANGLLATLNDRFLRSEELSEHADTTVSRVRVVSTFSASRQPGMVVSGEGNATPIDLRNIRDREWHADARATTTRLSCDSRVSNQTDGDGEESKTTVRI